MSLDATAKEFFVRSSLKKYFIDNLKTIEGITVVFDKTILYEEVKNYVTDKWIVINFGSFNRSLLSEFIININCCTRQDAEGVELSKLTDLVLDYLTDTLETDTLKRIPLYDSTNADPNLWTQVGTMVCTKIIETQQNYTPDATKVKTMPSIFKWASKI